VTNIQTVGHITTELALFLYLLLHAATKQRKPTYFRRY